MSKSRYPILVVRGVPVIAAPTALDLRGADVLRATLLHLAAAGHVTVVVDMSATTTCDAAGQAELGRAYKHAVAEGGDLRLVVSAGALAEILGDCRLRRVIRHYPTVADAVAETPAVRIVPFRAGSTARAGRSGARRWLRRYRCGNWAGAVAAARRAAAAWRVITLRVRGGELEHLVLADSSLVLTGAEGDTRVITDRRLDAALYGTRALLDQIRLRDPAYPEAFRDHMATVQGGRNAPGGFWVAATDPTVADTR